MGRTGRIKLAAALALLTLAVGCGGGETAAPVQTVDLSGLIQVDKLNEKLPVEKQELEAAIAETLQERAPAGVRVVYNPGAPPVQRFSQSGGGNQGSVKQKSPPASPATGTPPPPGGGTPSPAKQGEGVCERQVIDGKYVSYVCPEGVEPPADNGTQLPDPATPPPPGTPAKPSPGENAPSSAVCGFDPSKPGCENFCAQNPEFQTCKKPAPATPPPPEPEKPKVGDILPRPPEFADFSHCRQTETGPRCYKTREEDPFVRANSPPAGTPAPAGGGKKPLMVGDAYAPPPPPVGGESYGRCKYVTKSGTPGQGYIHCDILGTGGGKAYACPPEAACNSIQLNPICVANPGACDEFGAPELATLKSLLRGVIDDSFEKVGVELEPDSATAAVSLAEISIAGVKANVEASETGEIVTQVESPQDGAEGAESGPADPNAEEPTDPEVAPEGTEQPAAPEGEAPGVPPEGAPVPDAPAPESVPAPEAPAPDAPAPESVPAPVPETPPAQ
ncbi:MAG: hypothetical protein QOG62_2440 [Thermoleophilaceae bacterium]|jgi:hypothetical protein|nr:hypothetical protein [Thermoleophilaceae bacterium]